MRNECSLKENVLSELLELLKLEKIEENIDVIIRNGIFFTNKFIDFLELNPLMLIFEFFCIEHLNNHMVHSTFLS